MAEYLRGQWLPAVQTRLRPGTWVEYRNKVETHLIPAVGQVPLQQLTTAMLNALYKELLACGTSTRTVQYVHATIRKALNDAVRWGLLVRNPAHHAVSPRPSRESCAPGPPTSRATSWPPFVATRCTPPGSWRPSPGCAAARFSAALARPGAGGRLALGP
jgi:hypothetical protein